MRRRIYWKYFVLRRLASLIAGCFLVAVRHAASNADTFVCNVAAANSAAISNVTKTSFFFSSLRSSQPHYAQTPQYASQLPPQAQAYHHQPPPAAAAAAPQLQGGQPAMLDFRSTDQKIKDTNPHAVTNVGANDGLLRAGRAAQSAEEARSLSCRALCPPRAQAWSIEQPG